MAVQKNSLHHHGNWCSQSCIIKQTGVNTVTVQCIMIMSRSNGRQRTYFLPWIYFTKLIPWQLFWEKTAAKSCLKQYIMHKFHRMWNLAGLYMDLFHTAKTMLWFVNTDIVTDIIKEVHFKSHHSKKNEVISNFT